MGGALFHDHASGNFFVWHQVSLGGSDAVAAKCSMEDGALAHGVVVKNEDNGVSNRQEFEAAIQDCNQCIALSGVGAKHQNATAEWTIIVVQNMACAVHCQVQTLWLEEFNPSHWPFALSHTVWICTQSPHGDHQANVSAEEIFSKTIVQQEPCNDVRDFNQDGDFKSCLAVLLHTLNDGLLRLLQPHLALSLLETTRMNEGGPVHTPSSGPLFCNTESKLFDQLFNC